VSRYQQSKTKLDFTEARDSEWQWHQLGHMQVCTSLQTDYCTSTPPLSCFTGQSTEGVKSQLLTSKYALQNKVVIMTMIYLKCCNPSTMRYTIQQV